MNTKNKPVKYGRFALISIIALLVLGGSVFYLRPIMVLSWATGIQLRLNGFESKYVQTESYKMHYWVGGEGKPLILVHGAGADGQSFLSIMPNLAKNYRVYAIDLPGFGDSDKPSEPDYSTRFQAMQLYNFAKTLQIEKAYVLGLCMGGNVTLTFAHNWPERVEKMILVNGPFIYDQKLYKLDFSFFDNPQNIEEIRYFFDNSNVPEYPDFILRDILRIFQEQSWILQRVTGTIFTEAESWNRDKFSKLKMPVLLLWGKKDFAFPEEVGKRTHRALPNSVFISFAECKHLEAGDNCSNLILPEVEKFLSGKSYPAGSTIEVPAPSQ